SGVREWRGWVGGGRGRAPAGGGRQKGRRVPPLFAPGDAPAGGFFPHTPLPAPPPRGPINSPLRPPPPSRSGASRVRILHFLHFSRSPGLVEDRLQRTEEPPGPACRTGGSGRASLPSRSPACRRSPGAASPRS